MSLARIRILLVIAVALFAPVSSKATSVFSMLLLGEPIESGDVRAISLGGSTQLFVDSLGAVQLNPALLSRIPRATVGATQYLAVDQGRSNEFKERDVSYTFSSVRAVFPVSRWVRLSIGYAGRYEPGGGLTLRGVTAGGEGYRQTYTTDGGLFSVPLTASFDVTRFASVGLTFSLEQGSLQERWDTVFDNPSFAAAAGLKKQSLNGTGMGGGLVLHAGGGFMIGGMYESAVEYDTDVSEKFTQVVLDTSYTSSMKLPARVSLGATWRIRDRFVLLASGAWSDFTKSEGTGGPAGDLRSQQSVCVGAEYLRGFRMGGARLPIRLGYNYQRMPFEFPSGEIVAKHLVSIGTGITIKNGQGKLDIAIVVGKDGSMTANGLEDRLFRFYLGVSGGEEWKRKGGQID